MGSLDHDYTLPPSLSSGGVDSAQDCEAAHGSTPTRKTALPRGSPGATCSVGAAQWKRGDPPRSLTL